MKKPKPKKQWRPKVGERVYYVDAEVCPNARINYCPCLGEFTKYKAYRTKREAQSVANKIRRLLFR